MCDLNWRPKGNRKIGRLNVYVNQLLISKNDSRVINRVIDIL